MYSPNRTTGQWRAHGRYIARESVRQGHAVNVYGNQAEGVALADVLDQWQRAGNPAPLENDRIAGIWRTNRSEPTDARARSGHTPGLDYRPHFNTEHPHAHIALRGIKAGCSPLDLKREYVRKGIRSIAEDLCTRQIGHRNQVDAMVAERREIQECRYTSLDRIINRASAARPIDGSGDDNHFVVRRDVNTVHAEFAEIREQHLAARLMVLQKMGLAEEAAPRDWRDFEGVLRAIQRVGDRQKMLAAHGPAPDC